MTRRHNEALRPSGLRATQFTILQAPSLATELSQGQLGEMLVTDSTTLTRTLEIMGRHGWIVKRRSKDCWERRLGLAGQAQLKRALPRSGEIASPTPAATRPRALGHSDDARERSN